MKSRVFSRHLARLCALACLHVAAVTGFSADAAAGQIIVPVLTTSHPRLFVNAEELAVMRARVEQRQFPHVLAWEALELQLKKTTAPKPNNHANGDTFYKAANIQGGVARDLALAWWVTGDRRYAERAVDFLRAWSGLQPFPGTNLQDFTGKQSPDFGIWAVRGSLPFFYAADLLWDSGVLTASDKRALQEWATALVPVVKSCKAKWLASDYYGEQNYNNHLATHALGLAAFGVFLGDHSLLQFAIDSPDNDRDFRELIEGLILMPGDKPHHREPAAATPPQAGEIYDRFRHFSGPNKGLQYSSLSTLIMGMIAEIGRHQGMDLWSYRAPSGETLRLPYEFYSDFYRLSSSSIKGGFYAGENERLGKVGDTPGVFELGLARFPDSEPLRRLLWVTDRPIQHDHLLGPVMLTHGIVFPEQNGLTPRPKPARPLANKMNPAVIVPPIVKTHPRLVLDAAGLNAMKSRALSREEPWQTAWTSLKTRADQALLKADKFAPYTGTDAYAFYHALLPQAQAARDLALAWWITGDEKYATAAHQLILRWSSAHPLPASAISSDMSTLNKGMLLPRSSFPMIWAYDILAGRAQFSKEESAAFATWMRALVPQIRDAARIWKENNYFDHQYFQNHPAGEALGLIAIAITLGDRVLLQEAVNSSENDRDFLDLIAGTILMPGDDVYYREPPGAPAPKAGEIIDRYRHFQMGGHLADYVTFPTRGLQYCLLTTNLLALSAQMLETNGIPLWHYHAPGGESVRLPFSFYAKLYASGKSLAGETFYAGEEDRMTDGGDPRAMFELGAARYSEDPALRDALDWPGRATDTTPLIGSDVLIFGAPLTSKTRN